MADNMINLVAQLNISESEEVISEQLKTIQNDINKVGSLKIACTIDTSNIKQLQTQLGEISKGLNINVNTVGTNSIQQSMQQTANAVGNANQEVQQLSNSLANLNKKYTQLTGDNKLVNVFANATNTVDEKRTLAAIHKLYSELGEVETKVHTIGTRFSDVDVKIKSSTGEVRTLNLALKDISKPLEGFDVRNTTLSDSGIRKQVEEISKFVDTYTAKLNSLKAKVGESFLPNISATVGEDVNKTITTFDSFERKLLELSRGKGSVEELRAEFVALDGAVKNLGSLLRGGDSSLNQFTNAINNARNFDNTLKALTVDYENLGDVSKNLAFDSIANAQQKILDLQRTQDAEGYTERWIRQYQEASIAVRQLAEDIKLAKKLEQQDTTSATKKQTEALREISLAYKEIQKYTKTLYSNSATDVEKGFAGSHRGDQYAIIEQIKQRLESEGLLDQTLKNEILNYEAIAKEIELIAKSRQDAIATQRQEKESLQEVGKLIKDNLSALEKFNKSSIVGKNTSNVTVTSQIGINENLINQLRGLQESFASDKSPENVNRIKLKIDELSDSLRTATQNSMALEQSLKSSESSAKFTAKLNTLTNQMETFALANKNVTESLKRMRSGITFADEWQRIMTTLKSGNLDNNAIQRLTEDFRNLKGEAKSVGLVTENTFQRLKKSFSFLAPYFSSYRIVSTVISNIKSAVNELKSLDDILTEIAKVSDRTKDELTALGQSAFDVASKYGRTASDYLTGVQEMSRAGFAGEQAEQLAELSLRAQAAGYMTAEMANEYIVATNAGYELQGSIEKLNQVLDGQVYVTDRNALNMENLAEATKMAASQASSAGIGIDELTAAVGTMISVTQQGGAQAGRAFRGKLFAPYRCESISA